MALTRRQRQVLDVINTFIEENGYSPSLEEIGAQLDLSSVATVHKHVSHLVQKGFVRRTWNQNRSIEIVDASDSAPAVRVPLSGTIAAGQPLDAVANTETISLPAELVRDRGNTYVLKVEGSSMIDEQIRDGDFVVVERRKSVRDGETVVALIDGSEATLKRFYADNGEVRLQPANPTFNADGLLDLLVSTSKGSLFDATTEVGIHINRNGGWDLAKPDQVFKAKSGLTTNQVIDVDGDGLVELVSLRIPTGVLEVVEVLITRSIDAEVSVYRRGTTLPFEKKPWHTRKLSVAWSFETFRSRGFVPTLDADVNGDGIRDLVGSGDGDELDVRLGDNDDGYSSADASQNLDTGGRIRFGEFDQDGLTDFVLYDPRRPGTPVRVGVNRGVLPGTVRQPTIRGAVGGE